MSLTTYNVTIELQEDILGTVPKDREVYRTYIASRAADLGLAEEEVATVQQVEEKGWTGFHHDKDGTPFLYDYAIKGFLCEAARTLKQFGALKQLQDKFKRYAFVFPRKVALPPVVGVLERPLRAMTAQGPRVALARSDYVAAGGKIKFQIKVMEGGGITLGCLKAVLAYGELIGLGQWRTGSYGRFKVLSIDEA